MRSWVEIGIGLLFFGIIAAILQNWPVALGLGAVLFAYQGFRAWRNSPANREKSKRKETDALYAAALERVHLVTGEDPERAKVTWALPIYKSLPEIPDSLAEELIEVANDLYDMEHFHEELPKPPIRSDSLEGARYRDTLNAVVSRLADPAPRKIAQQIVQESLLNLIKHLPKLPVESGDALGALRLEEFGDVRYAVLEAVLPLYRHTAKDHGLFKEIRHQLDENLCNASGLAYSKAAMESDRLVSPDEYEGNDVVGKYLGRTPYEAVFKVQLPLCIPEELRYEHTMIVAGSGHGKTTLLGEMILSDLEKAMDGGGGFAVIDPKGILIDTISHLACFSPDDGELHDRLIIIDPRQDVAHPPAINMFDLGSSLDDLDEADRLAVRNNALELIEYLFTELLSVDMTGRQESAFRYVGDLMMTIPNATIMTLREFLERPEDFVEYIEQCDNTTRDYLSNQFMSSRFKAVREQLLDRGSTYTIPLPTPYILRHVLLLPKPAYLQNLRRSRT